MEVRYHLYASSSGMSPRVRRTRALSGRVRKKAASVQEKRRQLACEKRSAGQAWIETNIGSLGENLEAARPIRQHFGDAWFSNPVLHYFRRSARAAIFLRTQSGQQTLDQDESGGNPFASALIELMSRRNLTLGKLPAQLKKLTFRNSGGFQVPDVPSFAAPEKWSVQSKAQGEKKVALVLVFSDYSASGGAPSLPGAKLDASRIGKAFKTAGFKTEISVDPSRDEFNEILRNFSDPSSHADFTVVYATGHGVEVDRKIYLLPGDYPVAEENRALDEKAIRVSRIASALRGRRASLMFYAGCRDNPFGEP